MTKNKVKILYIGGYARCGSTILSRVIGEVEGFFNAGELMYMWDQILTDKGTCGCGRHVTRCPEWQAILHTAFGPQIDVNNHQMMQLRNGLWGSRRLPFWLLSGRKEQALIRHIAPYLTAMSKLYSAIGQERKEKVIIDSSKNPAYLFFLTHVPEVELHVVHIVRDSRATAYSWLRKKKGFRSVSTSRSSLQWDGRNLSFDLLRKRLQGRYLQIRYEDFINEPKQGLKRILEFVGESQMPIDFIGDDGIAFRPNHCVYGNPDLFTNGKIKLRFDDAWKQMRFRDWLVATALTFPILMRYGYPIFR